MSCPKLKSILKKTSVYSTDINPNKENRGWCSLSLKQKKSVQFAAGTIGYDRESKAYKYHSIFKQDLLTKFPVEPTKNPIDTFLSSGQISEINPEDEDSNTFISNAYTHFTHAKRLSLDLLRKNSESLARSRKFFSILQELKSCHEEYNALDSALENRDSYLVHEILKRYIISLDLSLAEGYFGMSLNLLLTIADTTASMIPLYSHIFYNLDGSYRQLPQSEDMAAYIHSLVPVICALNRISENRSQTNNSGLNIETLLTKLQLELIVITLAPIDSLIFRTVLEIVPGTACAAVELLRDLLSTSSCLWIKWINNSNLRNDYTKILKTINLDDSSNAPGFSEYDENTNNIIQDFNN